MRVRVWPVGTWCILPLLPLLSATNCLAQNGSIAGAVKDSQDANLVRPIVTLTDSRKQTCLKALTNE